jgi:PKD repeat protein
MMGKIKTFSFLISILFFLFQFSFVKAGENENVAGWAWSENVGWISFNSLNCDTNGDGKSDGSPPGCPPAGTSIANYGVNLDPSTKIFSGYAWSEHIGWITFNEAELSGCPSPPCRAWLDSENKVHGWAKALVDGGGWSGWIRLSDTNYGVWLDTSTSPQEFRGWAWSDMVVGWVSFNCRDRNVCSSSNYKVYLTNQLPTVSNPYATQDSCAWGKSPQVAPGLVITLHWTYSDPDGDPRSAFEIWLDDSSNFQDSKFNKIFNISSGEPSQSYVLNLSDDQEGDWLNRLAWGTTYYWKVRVRDSAGNWSNWSTVDSFTTPSHAYPYVNFTWSPQSPTVNHVIQFTDLSECYNPSDSIIPCSSWYWSFENGNPSYATSQNPTTTFTSIGSNKVTLRVTDFLGYSCEDSKTVTSTYPLPFWREIIPPTFFKMKNLLTALISTIFKIRFF